MSSSVPQATAFVILLPRPGLSPCGRSRVRAGCPVGQRLLIMPHKHGPMRIQKTNAGRPFPGTPHRWLWSDNAEALILYLPSPLNSDLMRSRFSWEMDSSGMPFGQTAEHSPMLVQFPKPSSSCWATIDFTRR